VFEHGIKAGGRWRIIGSLVLNWSHIRNSLFPFDCARVAPASQGEPFEIQLWLCVSRSYKIKRPAIRPWHDVVEKQIKSDQEGWNTSHCTIQFLRFSLLVELSLLQEFWVSSYLPHVPSHIHMPGGCLSRIDQWWLWSCAHPSRQWFPTLWY
jgi:hypothetical protein